MKPFSRENRNSEGRMPGAGSGRDRQRGQNKLYLLRRGSVLEISRKGGDEHQRANLRCQSAVSRFGLCGITRAEQN